MAASDKTTIGANFNQSGSGLFPDNTSREISEADLRAFVDAVLQSYPNILDNAFDGLKGLKPGISTIAGLKAISTVALSTGVFCSFRDTGSNNVLRTYELIAGAGTSPADDESSPKQIAPNDYSSGLPKIWKLAKNNILVDWDMSTNDFPIGYDGGTIFSGTELSGRTTLTDNATPPALLPNKVVAIQLIDNATTSADFIFLTPIF